ncbi:LytR family transcriptional regulator [Acrocarpospora phusangensis]|uniref:LytR family transcriptional regulator n=1 Tax=Acrocarpospora phusangensis TaxID=1070424 RepID=A0A919ULC7_9ACTN|nr:LCP family protein [Acrocarpospora phusangensis]GIH22037.1 LytR family transcriptional regulator [Acrocarpospora phusangensis]
MEDSGVRVGGDAYGGVRVSAPRTRRTRTSVRSLVITATLSSLVLVGSGFAWAIPEYLIGQIESVDAGTAGSSSRGALNILLVGVDKRDNLTRKEQNQLHLGRQTGERTDTMMVIHLSADQRKVTVVSLPRDTWVDVPGQGPHKINAAYQFGGAKLAVQTVQQATGLRINHYVAVNVMGFIDVVEALGGVTVCTPVAINDSKTKLQLAAGTHELNGVNALHYARTRATGRADLDRIDRQQQVISALLGKALSGDTLTNPVKLGALVDSTLRTLTVDQALAEDFLGLATQLKDVSTDDVSFATVPLTDVNYRTPTGESAVLWDKPAAREMFQRINNDQPLVPAVRPSKSPTASPSPSPTAATIAPNRIAIRLRNGTMVTGLGARTKAALLDAGFLVPTAPGDTATRSYKNTIIRYGPTRLDSARTVSAAFPGAELREVDIDGIEVILGAQNNTVHKPTISTPKPTPTAISTPTTKTATQNICKKP